MDIHEISEAVISALVDVLLLSKAIAVCVTIGQKNNNTFRVQINT